MQKKANNVKFISVNQLYQRYRCFLFKSAFIPLSFYYFREFIFFCFPPDVQSSSLDIRALIYSLRPAFLIHHLSTEHLVELKLSASCSGLLAPIITVLTNGCCNSQANAIWATVTCLSSAMFCITSITL